MRLGHSSQPFLLDGGAYFLYPNRIGFNSKVIGQPQLGLAGGLLFLSTPAQGPASTGRAVSETR
jgi:hypothetical protein